MQPFAVHPGSTVVPLHGGSATGAGAASAAASSPSAASSEASVGPASFGVTVPGVALLPLHALSGTEQAQASHRAPRRATRSVRVGLLLDESRLDAGAADRTKNWGTEEY